MDHSEQCISLKKHSICVPHIAVESRTKKKKRHKSYFLTRGRGRTKNFQIPGKRETTISPGPQDDNKKTYQANIFISNQTWSIQVVFASIQYRISGELLCFKFPAFVWICGGGNIASFWVQSLELNLHASDAWEIVAKWKCEHCHDYLMET